MSTSLPKPSLGALPSGIDFSNPNWSTGLDLRNIPQFAPYLNNSTIVGVNRGDGTIEYLPMGYVQAAQAGNANPHPFANTSLASGYSMGNGAGQASPAPTVNGMTFADYLNQIGVHVPGSTGTPSTDPNNPVAQIMAGFSTPSNSALPSMFGNVGTIYANRERSARNMPASVPANIQSLMPYYNQFQRMANGGSSSYGFTPAPSMSYGSGNPFAGNQLAQIQPTGTGYLGDTISAANMPAVQAMFQAAGPSTLRTFSSSGTSSPPNGIPANAGPSPIPYNPNSYRF